MVRLKRSWFVLLCILCFWAMFSTGCSKDASASEATADDIAPKKEIVQETEKPEKTETKDVSNDALTSKEETKDKPVIDEMHMLNPLTGKVVAIEGFPTRPLTVMLDNQYNARPQAGLINADIAYEILVEGRITRYMGVFLSHMPEHIGPIRSARPYFVQKSLEYNPFYVHVGGSMQAQSDIKTYKMADIDGLTSGAFHRESHKRKPHNMYSEAETLINYGLARGYYDTVDINFLSFNDTFTVLENSTPAQEIKFLYKAPTTSDKVGYYTTYKYDIASQTYLRFTNGHPHIDEDTEAQLYASNILVQYVTTKVIDSDGRLQLNLIGKGTGMYYTGGSGIPVTWEKSDAHAMTNFYDEKGNAIKLNPGKTWFQIMESDKKETIIAPE